MRLQAMRQQSGFTLLELMVVVVVATILVSLAVPSYMQQVRQSRRTEAKAAILDLAGREETYFATNGNAYTNTAANLGYATFTPIGSGYYNIAVCVATATGATPACDPNANAPTAPSYYITATPVAGLSQANDASCTSFSVDSTGQQFSTGTGVGSYCWQN